MNTENAMLNDSQLEGITGGAGASAPNTQFSGEIAPEACVVGQNYYLVSGNTWYYGQLVEITSRSSVPGETARMLKFRTITHNGFDAEMTLSLNAAQVKLYSAIVKGC